MFPATTDDFLNGAIRVLQPKDGYRAATDPVFLAAAVPAHAGETVLDVGCGVGVASLCLARRVVGCTVTGIEVQGEYADLAEQNQRANDLAFHVVNGDIIYPPDTIKGASFDHVMTNPPFFDGSANTPPENAGKTTANVEAISLTDWIKYALKRLKQRGTFTVVHRAERLPEILAALHLRCGDITVLPLAPRENRPAGRVIVQARKASAGPARLLAPFVVHQGRVHSGDQDDFTALAKSILRDGRELMLS